MDLIYLFYLSFVYKLRELWTAFQFKTLLICWKENVLLKSPEIL